MKLDNSLIEAALVGYQEELKRVDEAMKALRQRISESNGGVSAAVPVEKKKSRLSPAARRRIAAAQRKRWAAYKAALAKA